VSDVLKRQIGGAAYEAGLPAATSASTSALPSEAPKPVASSAEPNTDNPYVKALQETQSLLKEEKWAECVRECGELLERAMREALEGLLAAENGEEEKERIREAQRETAPGVRSVAGLRLPQLLDLYEKGEVFEALRRHLTSNVQKVRCVEWDQVLEWQEAAAQPGESGLLDHYAAMHMSYWTKVLIYDLELAGPKRRVPPVRPEDREVPQCPGCDIGIEEDWRFCPICGTPVKVTCQACHRVLAPEFKICPYCETRVTLRAAGNSAASQARDMYRIICQGAWIDGVVNARERAVLDGKRLELGLSTAEAEEIESQCAPENVVAYTRLLEGVLVDGVIDDQERAFLDAKAKELGLDEWVAKRTEQVALGGD
jgi:hypothetical protein